LPIIATVLVLGCAGLAYFGFRGRPTVVGIDLGTTYSVIAIRSGRGGIGDVEIVPDYEGDGGGIVPSVVHFQGVKRDKDGVERFVTKVGKGGKDMIKKDSLNTVYNAKRFIGGYYGSSEVTAQMDKQGFEVVEGGAWEDDEGNDDYEGTEEEGHVKRYPNFRLPNIPGRPVLPHEVGTEIVKHLLTQTSRHLGYDTSSTIKSAVVAVPAKFNQRQRQETAKAFKGAGLKVTRIMDEPTAAALAYGLHRKPHVHHILVYDFGGGTLDVSVLHVSEGYVEVVGTQGDDMLGGGDFDALVGERIYERIEDADKVRDGTGEECGGEGEDAPWCTREDVRVIAEQIKIEMADIEKDDDGPPAKFCRSVVRNGESCSVKNTSLTMTLGEFNDVVSPLLLRSYKPVEDVLDELELDAEDIDEVVMVGGTSRMPQVRKLVKEKMKKEYLNIDIDPDITVAYGCAAVID